MQTNSFLARARWMLTSLVTLTACQAQVGEDYTGEALLMLEGTVDVSEGADESLEPTLIFVLADGIQTVDGTTSGEFPSRFQFAVTEAPPEAAMFPLDTSDPSAGSIAMGRIAMLPKNHPQVLPLGRIVDSSSTTDCTDGEPCQTTKVECTADHACRTRQLECIEQACELIAAEGEPIDLSEPDVTGESRALYVSDELVLTAEITCQTTENCYREYRQCDTRATDAMVTAGSSGTTESCTILSETVDPGFFALDNLELAAENVLVFYASRDMEFPLVSLKQGYNVIEIVDPPTPERWAAALSCEYDAQSATLAQYNAVHGTEYRVLMEVDDDAERDEIEELIEAASAECPSGEPEFMVLDPLEASVSLRLGLYSAPSL